MKNCKFTDIYYVSYVHKKEFLYLWSLTRINIFPNHIFLQYLHTAACELHNSWIYRKPNKKHMYVYTYLYTYISIYFIKQYLDK